ncbi:MAG: DUF222 domain-containing protein, partial [Acidimicrobiales bacterium]
PALGDAGSIDALVGLDAAALDDSELKAALCDVARARARLDATEATLIAEFDQRASYVGDGAVNTRAWLAHHTGVARAVAGARVLLAKRLRRMPVMAAALVAGRVTAAHARALGRGLTPRTLDALARDEGLLVDKATELEADDYETLITRWLQLNDVDGPDPGAGRPSQFRASRHFGGRSRLDGDLDLEDSAEFLAELDALHDELFHAERAGEDTDPDRGRSRAERNAAALVEMARRSSAAGDRDTDTDTDADQARPASGPRSRRSQFIVVVDLPALAGEAGGLAELEDGTLLPPSILERWACDTAIGRVVMTGRSVPFDLGHVTYTPTNGQRRALVARDRGCIIPGCKRKARWCEAHHVVPWPQGPTNLENLVLVCKRHHKHIHARIITLQLDPTTEQWIATRPDGTPLRQRPPPLAA